MNARIDVTEVLSDPDFMTDGLTRIRRIETVNQFGRAVFTEEETPFTGVVTMPHDETRRNPESTIPMDSIVVTTTTELLGVNSTDNADTVRWQGRLYTVMSCHDNRIWGAGFYRAICHLVNYER